MKFFIRRFFKKAISLVLVLAMLAGFAGMTGFTPALIAEAAGSQTITFTGEGGLRVEMTSTLYKSPATSTTEISGMEVAVGDYIITAANNDLAYVLTVPDNMQWITGSLSVDGKAWHSGLWGAALTGSSYVPVFDRNEGNAELNDYGAYYRNHLKGTGGFKDVNYIYWRLEYGTDKNDQSNPDKRYSNEWRIPVVDISKKNNGVTVAWGEPATASRPEGSGAGQNKLSLSVPTTLYRNNDTDKIVLASVPDDGTALNTTVSVTWPSGAFNKKIHIDTETTFNTSNLKVHSDVNSVNVAGYVTQLSTDGIGRLFYMFTYDVFVGDKIVHYTQYAASYVTTLPTRAKAAWVLSSGATCTEQGDTNIAFDLLNTMSFFPALVSNGVLVSTSLRSDDANIGDIVVKNGAYSGEFFSGSGNSFALDSYTMTMGYDYSYGNYKNNTAYAVSGTYNTSTAYELPGGTIYFDPEAAGDLKITVNAYKWAWSGYENYSGTDQVKSKQNTSGIASYSEGWQTKSAYTGRYMDASTGSNWGGSNITDNTRVAQIDYGTSASMTTPDGITATGDALTGSIWTGNVGTRTYSFSRSQYTSDTYLQLVQKFVSNSNTHRFEYGCDSVSNHTLNFTQYVGWFVDLKPVTRTIAHDVIELAIANNYVEDEMDPTWWANYKAQMFDEYIRLGNLSDQTSGTNSDGDGWSGHIDRLNNPQYRLTDYTELNAAIKTTADWDRGGKIKPDLSGPVENGLDCGAKYIEWNIGTYGSINTIINADGTTTVVEGKVSDRYATYNLYFDTQTKTFSITDEIRTGEYYYTSATWAAYEAARFEAMNVYNYPATPKTEADYNKTEKPANHVYDEVLFDYDALYPAKTASKTTQTGLACYRQGEVDAAVAQLNATRDKLQLKTNDDPEGKREIEAAYNALIEAANIAYDGDKYEADVTDADGNVIKAAGSPRTLSLTKQGYIIPKKTDGTSNYYDPETHKYDYSFESLQFRATHPDDVFENIDSGGLVICNEAGQPLLKGSDTLLATENGDTGILYFPYVERPVGKGNTFTQLVFDDSVRSGYAVTNTRTAIGNRLKWEVGGNGDLDGDDIGDWTYLKMVKGAYTETVDGKGSSKSSETDTEVIYLTEQMLIDSPEDYMWTSVEHIDDIYRCAYAMIRVNNTLRLATNFKGVYDALNMTVTQNNTLVANSKVPSYEINGAKYLENQLDTVTTFHGYSKPTTTAWDQPISGTAYTLKNNTTQKTYATTGKTWYTEETWNEFIADRNALAALIYDGSSGVTTLPTDDTDAGLAALDQLAKNEVGNDFDYQSGLNNRYYTYDVILPGANGQITNRYFTNGVYRNSLTDEEIDESGIPNLAAKGQAKVNELVNDYLAWFDGKKVEDDPDTEDIDETNHELELKDLDAYVWEAYPEKGSVTEIKNQVTSMLSEVVKYQDNYDFVTVRENPDDPTSRITDGELNIYLKGQEGSFTLYDSEATAELVALADAVTALEASEEHTNTPYNGDDFLGDKGEAFDNALKAFYNKYTAIKAAGVYTNTDSWNEILSHLTELAEMSGTEKIHTGNLSSKFTSLYKDDDGTIYAELEAAIDDFDAAGNDQDKINKAVERLYNALNNDCKSVSIATVVGTDESPATGTVLSYPNEHTFKIYNYTAEERAGKNDEKSQFTEKSIDILINGITDENGNKIQKGAKDYRDNAYPMLSTYVSTITADKEAASKLTGLASDNNGGVLVYADAVTTYLEQAIAYAESQLYEQIYEEQTDENGETVMVSKGFATDEEGNKVVKSFTATSPEGETVNVPMFTEQSIAELQATIAEARAAIAAKHTFADQLEIDKLTYAVFEETEDSADYLVASKHILNYGNPYSWGIDEDGNLVKVDEWQDSSIEYYTALLYGTRRAEINATTGKPDFPSMANQGLQAAPPYLGFLEIELSTPHELDVEGKHWYLSGDKQGWAILDANGKVSTDTTVFDGSWGTYATAYDNGYGAYTTGTHLNKTLTYKDQKDVVDVLAKAIYDARNALKSGVRYFPNNSTDFATARNYYNTLEAYLYTTPITRYEVVKDANGNATGVSTWVENVPLYTFPLLKDENGNEETETYPVYEKVTNENKEDVLDGDQKPVYKPVTELNADGEEVQKYASTDDTKVILEAYITMYRAKYASSASTADYDSIKAATKLYQDINGYTDENEVFHPGLVQTLGITLKKTNDPSLIAGLEDLKENFIAGTWAEVEQDDGTKMWTYTSDLLNKDQIKMLQDDLTLAQDQFSADKAVTANFGNEIVSYTNKIFTDTQNPATDLQFAVYMRDEELFNFLDTTIQGSVPFYYGGDGTYEIRLFRGTTVNTLKNSIGYDRKGEEYSNSFFGMLDAGTWPLSDGSGSTVGWPTIYEVNDINWNKSKAEEGSEAVSVTGYTGDASTHKYAGENAAIVAILEQVGSYSNNYVYAAGYLNSFNIEPYEWLAENAMPKGKYENGVVLGEYKKTGVDYPRSYKTPDWYHGDDYATVVDSDGGYYDEYWFANIDSLETYINPEIEAFEIIQEYGLDVWVVAEEKGENYIDYLNSNGWTPQDAEYFEDYIVEFQSPIDSLTEEWYQAICNLQLLPATEAYRKVINAYHSLFAENLTWSDGYNGWAPASGTAGTIYAADGINSLYTFYNTTDTVFLSKVRNGITDETNFNGNPPYGTVYTYTPVYKDKNAQYTGNKENQMAKLVAWYDSIVNTAIEDAITIDMEEKVYSYGLAGDPSEYDKFISYASQLELVDNNYALINAIIETLLTGDLGKLQRADTEGGYAKLFGDWDNMPDIVSSVGKDGELLNVQYYTDASLVEFAQVLLRNNVVLQSNGTSTLISQDNEGNNKVITISDWESFKNNTYINSLAQTDADKLVRETLIPALNTCLVLKAADATSIKNTINGTNEQKGATYYTTNKDLFVQDGAWTTFMNALEAAEDALVMCDETVAGYYTAKYDQDKVTKVVDDLTSAMDNLTRKADSASPEISVTVDTVGINNFYKNARSADGVAALDSVDTTGASDPATGTVFMPNNGGYSLLVYTNEVSPRILLQIEDKDQKVGDNDAVIEASKKETISVKSQRTSGTVTNLIYGTMDSGNVILDINNRNLKTDAQANATTPDSTGPLGSYVNATKDTKDPTKNEAGSSVFAILAPEFSNTNASAAAIYSISVKDVVSQESGVQASGDNYSKSLIVGNATADISETVSSETNMITVYIYYHSSMAANNTDGSVNDEGIVVENGMASLATPVVSAAGHVASVLLSGEPNYTGAWRRGIGLTRAFGSAVRSWEFMSQLGSENSIGTVKNVAFDDPTFGEKNLGSFYYVLDSQADEGTVDADVIAAYKSGKDSTAGLMDYDRATAAKTEMITQINEMSDDALNTFKASKNFNLYGGTDAAGNYINYAQVLTDKVEMGDLVFIHVVDRWGNVVNRIVEITNLDKVIPVVKATEGVSGQVTITEEGGSGIKDITVHNGDFSLGDVDYKIDSTQNVTFTENVVDYVNVVTANNKLTLSKLVPGKTYYIGTVDNAGNSSSTGVKANANGEIALTVTNTTASAETTEEGSVASNSSTFTLNGTDMITINAGEASSIIDASLEGNVFANRAIRHYVTTKDTVTAIKTVYQDGTVEEWTPDDVTVKDNGDGTLRWLIPRTLTPGEHSYKLYAKVDGEYETFYAPATITATNRTIRFTYTIAGMGRTVLKYSGSSEIKNSTMDSREIPYGAKVTITAEQTSTSSDFYYWLNSSNERIISTSNTYEFTAVTNTSLTAQFTSYESLYEGKKLVIYVNNAKNVIKAFELADGDNYTVPAGPVLPDYTFEGWSMTKDQVLASDKDTVVVEPVYTLSAENTVTITQGNYTATGEGTYKAENNQRAVVTISTDAKDGDGNEFLYWIDADTNEIVSYDRTYSFFCVKDTVLTPVYGDASAVTVEPIVRITEVKYNALSGKVSFFAERSVPEEFTILQTGIVVTKTESIGTNEDVFVVGGTSTAAGTSTNTANNGYYSAATAVAAGQSVWARAYVIYETASGEILEAYGPVASYTVD